MQQKIIKLFALTVAVLCVSPLQAQKAIGLVAGYNLTNLLRSPSQAGTSHEQRARLTGGALIELDFLQKISVQFEPMYVQKGAYFDFVDPETFNAGRDEVDLAYLDLPVLLKFRLQDRLTAPYLLAGPTFSLLISAKQGGRDSKADIKDNRESYDVGIGGGFGIFLTSEQAKVFVEGRYNYGLINIDKAAENGATLRNNGFRLLLGILL